MKRLTKEEIKKIQLDMLSYIDEICLENNIKYTLVGGSLIGAIRHKGMIPWDDDIDIALTQEEYNKLMSILQNSTNSYVLLNHDINSKFYFPFTKLVYNKTLLKEQGFDFIPGYGVFIDIFCYHQVPNNTKQNKKHFKKLKLYNKMLGGIKRVYKTKNILKNIIKYMRYFYLRIVSEEYYFKKLKKLYTEYENKSCDYLLSNWPVYSYQQEIKPKKYFTEYIRVPFEHLEVWIIKDYDKYLQEVFGDYMKLPPVKEQRTHDLEVYWTEEEE